MPYNLGILLKVITTRTGHSDGFDYGCKTSSFLSASAAVQSLAHVANEYKKKNDYKVLSNKKGKLELSHLGWSGPNQTPIDAFSELSILFLPASGFFDVNFNCWWQLLLLETATLVSWVVFRPIRSTLGLTIQIFHPFCMALPSFIPFWGIKKMTVKKYLKRFKIGLAHL